MTPRVSVVIPTRNRLGSLQRALASVEEQRFRDFEVVVVDDGSTDGTASWLQRNGRGLEIIRTEQPSGAAAARNRAIRRSQGDLIAFLDDDDRWRPGYLGAQVAHHDANPTTDLSYVDHVEIDQHGGMTSPDTRALLDYGSVQAWLLAECFIHTMSVVVCRRAMVDRVGLLDERLTIVHDLDWYARILGQGGTIALETGWSPPLVERTVPGGLVSSHRHWFEEESEVIDRAIAATPTLAKDQRTIRAYRSMFFFRVGLAKGDLSFALRRLVDAFLASPRWAVVVAGRRLARHASSRRGRHLRRPAALSPQ